MAGGLIIALWLAGWIFSHVHWTQPQGKPLQVSLVQGNIPQTLKWQPEQAEASLDLYEQLTQQHLDSQLIIWPEAAITFLQTQIPDRLNSLSNTLKSHAISLITGIPVVEQALPEDRYYNGVIALGNSNGVYYKRHLVPFGEFMPLRPLLRWLKNYVEIPMSDFSRGARHQPLIQAGSAPIAIFICYEITYPTEVLDALPKGQLLITVSDDSWFGRSIAPAQHLEIAQMRALETGRYLLMSTNDGITAIVDPQGRIQASLPRYVTTVLTGKIQFMQGSTPWIQLGVYPIMLFMLLMLLFALVRQRSKENAPPP